MKKLLSVIAAVLMLASAASAQTLTVDLSKINSTVAQQILQEQQRLKGTSKSSAIEVPDTGSMESIDKWASFGKNLAEGVAATARGLSIEVNEFVKTPVGKITFFLIAWKFFGAKLWAVFAGTLIWITLGTIIWKSFCNFHRPKKRLAKVDGKVKEYTWETFRWQSEEAKVVSVIVHFAAFATLSIVMMCQIL